MGSVVHASRRHGSDRRSSAERSRANSLEGTLSDAAQVAIDLLSRKWVIKIVDALAPGPLRQFQLRAALSSVRPKVLRETLHVLEQQGLVERVLCRDDASGASVAYCLTDAGQTLCIPINAIAEWANVMLPRRPTPGEVAARPLLAEGA